MNILLYSGEFPPENGWGGIATYTFYMAKALSRAGHKVVVLSQAVQGVPDYSSRNEFEVYRYKKFNTNYYLARLGLKSKRVLRLLYLMDTQIAVGFQTRKIERNHRIHIVEYPDSYADGIMHKLFCKSPYIVKLHVPAFTVDQLWGSSQSILIQSMETRFVKNANFVLSPSQCIAKLVREKCKISSIKLIANPIDTQEFSPSPSKGEYILFTGWISPVKGIDTLLKAIAIVVQYYPNIRVKIVGAPITTDYGIKMAILSEQLGITNNIQWCGRLGREKISEMHKNSMFSVLPSNWENSPYACIESLACGKPVVASNIGGIPELIKDHETGLLVEKGNPESLSEGIIMLVSNPALAYEYGQKGRRLIENEHSLDVVGEEVTRLYSGILGRGMDVE